LGLGQGLKWLAHRGSALLPMVGPGVRVAIAAATIEGLGRVIIQHYERKHPGKMFTRKE
jgi:hypothetical protein